MADAADISAQAPGWRYTEKPPKLDRRFAFDAYAEARSFLDRLAELSKRENDYPDLSFGRTHVHVTINARDRQAIGEADIAFANRAAALGGARAARRDGER